MAKIVNSWNDWDPLKRVIVGLCDNSVIPPEEPATSEKVPVDSEMRGMWGLRPLRTVEVGNACLENLVKALEERGVVVDRPTPLQWNQAIGTPDFRNDSMMTCMPPRDILLTMGNEIMASANSFRCRYFEYLAYWPLMKQYFDEDPDFLWTQAPRPRLTDKSYKHNYYDEKISLEERLVRTANKDFVTTEVEPMWDAADVMREIKSYGNGLTAPRDICDPQSAKAYVWMLAESVAQRMREGRARARTVSVGARAADDLCTRSRQCKLPVATDVTLEVARAAWGLLRELEPLDASHPLRGIHVRASDLEPADADLQASLFDPLPRRTEMRELDASVDDLRRRYGNKCVVWGAQLVDEGAASVDAKADNTVHPVSFFHS